MSETVGGAIEAVVGVAFAAFCIWLMVRIVNRREIWAVVTAIVFAAGATLLTLMYCIDTSYYARIM